MNTTQNDITQTIIDTINSLFTQLFSSIDNQIYAMLDHLTFVDASILHDSYMGNLFTDSSLQQFLTIANALLIGFALYYCGRLLFSHFSYIEIEKPYQFVFKLLIFGISLNCSYFICEQFLELNSLLSDALLSIGKSVFHTNISFDAFINNLNSIVTIEENSFNIFSVDGLIKGFISFGLFQLVFSYALRYIMIKVFVLIAPFAFLTLVNHSTSWFFKTWLRSLTSLLLLQSLIAIILLILFSIRFDIKDLFSKFLYIGGIYALSKAGSYIRELIGGISTDITNGFSNLRSFIKQ